jgi:hypothetical protein
MCVLVLGNSVFYKSEKIFMKAQKKNLLQMQQGCFITPYFCPLYDDYWALLIEIKISTSLWAGPKCRRKVSIIRKEQKLVNFCNILRVQSSMIGPISCDIFACRDCRTQIWVETLSLKQNSEQSNLNIRVSFMCILFDDFLCFTFFLYESRSNLLENPITKDNIDSYFLYK